MTLHTFNVARQMARVIFLSEGRQKSELKLSGSRDKVYEMAMQIQEDIKSGTYDIPYYLQRHPVADKVRELMKANTDGSIIYTSRSQAASSARPASEKDSDDSITDESSESD